MDAEQKSNPEASDANSPKISNVTQPIQGNRYLSNEKPKSRPTKIWTIGLAIFVFFILSAGAIGLFRYINWTQPHNELKKQLDAAPVPADFTVVSTEISGCRFCIDAGILGGVRHYSTEKTAQEVYDEIRSVMNLMGYAAKLEPEKTNQALPANEIRIANSFQKQNQIYDIDVIGLVNGPITTPTKINYIPLTAYKQPQKNVDSKHKLEDSLIPSLDITSYTLPNADGGFSYVNSDIDTSNNPPLLRLYFKLGDDSITLEETTSSALHRWMPTANSLKTPNQRPYFVDCPYVDGSCGGADTVIGQTSISIALDSRPTSVPTSYGKTQAFFEKLIESLQPITNTQLKSLIDTSTQ